MDKVTVFDAARILGTTPQEAKELVGERAATLHEVETLALEHYRWKVHVDDPDSYWVTVKQAAEIVGVSTQRVKQLLEKGLLPFVVTNGSVRLMRREQLITVANARLSRKLTS